MGIFTQFHTNSIDVYDGIIHNKQLKDIDKELSYEDDQILLPKISRGIDNLEWFSILVKLHKLIIEQKIEIGYSYLHWTCSCGDAIGGTILFNQTSVVMFEMDMDGKLNIRQRYEPEIERNT